MGEISGGNDKTIKQKTIAQAILGMMGEKKRSMTSQEICQLILERNLYHFNTDDTQGMVYNALWRHSSKTKDHSSPNKFFYKNGNTMRQDNRYMSYVQQHIKFDEGIMIRDQNAIYKSASGFLKILYPHLELTLSDFESDCLKPALQMRQAIRTIMYNLDDEFRQSGKKIIAEVK